MNNRKIYYIVCLNEDFIMSDTIISHRFCGYIEQYYVGVIWFRLKGSNALVIVPMDEIKYMAPSKADWTGEEEKI